MALLSADHLAGPGYIILNVLRGLNIIALASVVASSIVMLVKTFIVSKVRQEYIKFELQAHLFSSSSSMPQVTSSQPSLVSSLSSLNAPYSAASSLAIGLF
jgi:hypothetical protein